MKLTNKNLREIKSAVNKGFGLKVSYPKRSENQTLLIYKEYLIRPKNIRPSPGERYVSVRTLAPGKKLSRGASPRNYKINNLLLNVNGKPSPTRSANKKSPTPGKRPRTSIR